MAPSSEDLANFISITQASPEDAARFLEGTDLQTAVSNFFAAGEPEDASAEEDDPMLPAETEAAPTLAPAPASVPAATEGGARTLSGAPAEPLPAGWGQPARNMLGRVGQNSGAPEPRSAAGGSGPRIATLGSVGRAGEPENFYAGGEKSGLAVQNPNGPSGNSNDDEDDGGIVGNILKQANEGSKRIEERVKAAAASASAAVTSAFTGTGNTLGSDETPSTVIPDPSGSRRTGSGARTPGARGILAGLGGQASDDGEEEEDDDNVQQRRLIFWRNGFSIEDGPLRPYDAEENQALLAAIHAGNAPPNVFGVRVNQQLQVVVQHLKDQDYTPPPKRPMKPFEGEGNRLGAPTPQIAESSRTMPGSMPTSILQGGSGSGASTPRASPAVREFAVDESKPTTRIQVRLGDGTRMTARVNLTHTVGDLRRFIDASRPETRSYALQTTFPNRDLADENETIAQAKLENAVVVQRWT